MPSTSNPKTGTRPAAPVSPLPPLNLSPIDSILIVSFGGPEAPDQVIPFLENVLRGKNVPRERMLEVADHYQHFGGVSPINAQCRELIEAVQAELIQREIHLPVYWGNRNWHPLLADTLKQMGDDGRKRGIAFFTSIFSSYSGCRQYRENIADAQASVGESAPIIERARLGFNHPRFIAAQRDCLFEALEQLPEGERDDATILFCAHSIPLVMSEHSNYLLQLNESARLICEAAGCDRWQLAFQSRSGPPHQPWLEPDVCDYAKQLFQEEGLQNLIVVPLGFISDHIEVLYDLDEELAEVCEALGVRFVRAKTVGVHPEFVRMVVDLIEERLTEGTPRPCVGDLSPNPDLCPSDCCLYPVTRPPV